jgi:hypothetical protein
MRNRVPLLVRTEARPARRLQLGEKFRRSAHALVTSLQEEKHESQYGPSHGSSLVTTMREANLKCLASYLGDLIGLSYTAAPSLQCLSAWFVLIGKVPNSTDTW